MLAKLIDRISTFLFYNSTNLRKTFYELQKINYKESAEFIHQHGNNAMLFQNKEEFRGHAINKVMDSGMILEFGVFQGKSINFFSQTLLMKKDTRVIYGFDSFEGLSEDWVGTNMLRSTFTQKGKSPKVNKNVKLIKGWIDDTLPTFLKENLNDRSEIAFIHIDVDSYSPTKIIFENTVHLLKPGSIIVFDELLGYAGWRNGEYRALTEIISPRWNFQYISFCEPIYKNRHTSRFIRAAIKITERKSI
jgi:predicted O-methyltransferase YrrM